MHATQHVELVDPCLASTVVRHWPRWGWTWVRGWRGRTRRTRARGSWRRRGQWTVATLACHPAEGLNLGVVAVLLHVWTHVTAIFAAWWVREGAVANVT